MLGTSGISASASRATREQQENQVFRQRHNGASNVYNDEERDNQDENLNDVLSLLRSSANSRRNVKCVERRPVTTKENGGIDNRMYEK